MNVTIDVKLTQQDLYKFNMQQAYKGMQGILSIVLPFLVFAYTIATFGEVSLPSTLVYAGLGIMFLVYVPISLWLRVKKVITDPNNALSKTIRYEFGEEQIRVSVEAEQVEFKWENIFQMKTSGNLVLVYTNRINAYILPKEQIGDGYDALSKLAHAKLEKHRINMK